MGIEEIRNIKNKALLPKEEKKYVIPKISKKTQAKKDAEKELRGDNDPLKEQWFKARRIEMVGVCQCGCSAKSQKSDDTFFRGSICHIFPKSVFESVMYHPINWVERAMFGGCHDNMDQQGLDKWPMMADWEDIKDRFHVLAPLLTDEERATKFYSSLEKLIYGSVVVATGDPEVKAIIVQ